MIDPSTRARGAWKELETKLRPFVARRVAGDADVDDVVQDVFLRMQKGLPDLRDDERFGPWVYQVARSAVLDHLRRAKRNPVARNASAHTADGADETATTALEPDAQDVDVEAHLAAYVATFVAMLPSPYREALTLVELEGLTQKEAAAMLGISLSGMKSRVQRGRRELRKAFEECCHIALDARGRVIACEPRPNGKLPDGCCS